MSISQKKIDVLMEIGAGAIIDSTLSKLIDIQIARYQNNIKEISAELKEFEKRFGMSSEECYRRFESGELGDEGDFFEWIGLYENVLLFKKQVEILESAIRE
jgi:DNA-binding SARP family transcriptional activator